MCPVNKPGGLLSGHWGISGDRISARFSGGERQRKVERLTEHITFCPGCDDPGDVAGVLLTLEQQVIGTFETNEAFG